MSFVLVILGLVPAALLIRMWDDGWPARLFFGFAAMGNWFLFYNINAGAIARWWRLCQLGMCFG